MSTVDMVFLEKKAPSKEGALINKEITSH